jgi:hypothetical protein
MNEAHDPALRALLLHRLAAPEAAALEERILLEDGFAERVELERIDLLDDYAANRLDAVDREAMERWLLRTPEDRHRVALARAMFDRAGSRRSRRWILPAGAALAACLALVLVLPLLQTRAPIATPQPAAPQPDGPTAAPAPPALPAYAITLLADVERGAAARRIDIPAGTGVLHLQLEVPQPDGAVAGADFRVVIRDEGGERFAATGLKAQDIGPYRVVELEVARATAGNGVRRIILSQDDPAGASRELSVWTVQFESAP